MVAVLALLLGGIPACGVLFPLHSAGSRDAGDGHDGDTRSGDSGTDGAPVSSCDGGACSDPCDSVDCEPDERCADGQCVSLDHDVDGDGYPAASDCDDDDPSVVPGSTRPCETECGTGTETCSEGSWQACTAPTECECVPGDERPEPCGRCGSVTRSCGQDGRWGGAGACSGEGECMFGDSQEQTCGSCGQQIRFCAANCVWGDWGGCVEGGECVPGVIDSRSCGRCGTQGRTCGDDCAWGAWGECIGEAGVCAPGAEEACEANCGQRTCSDDCTWGDCSVPCHCEELGNIGSGCPGFAVSYFDPGCPGTNVRWANCGAGCNYTMGDCVPPNI